MFNNDKQLFNPNPTRGGGGGHCAPPPPPSPRYTSSNISRTPCATDLKLSDNLNELIFKTQNYSSTDSAHPWLPQQSPESTHVFEKHISAVFMQKLRNRLFCFFHEEHPKCSLLWKFGLGIPFDGVVVTIFVSHSISCFNDLKLGNTITMAPRKVSFNLVFINFQKKVTFVDFQRGEQGFWFLNRGSQHTNQSCVTRFIFGQAFRKTLLEWTLRRLTSFLLGPPPPPPQQH